MAASGDPLWINASGGSPALTAAELRRAMTLAMTSGAAHRLGARAGVRPGATAPVTLSGTTITVQNLAACVYPGVTSTSGPYWVAVLQGTHTLTAADPSNPRVDIVYLRVYDNDEDASGQRTATTEYLAGTPAASPSAPATPSGALRLATITVPASGGGSATLTYDAQWTVASGGIVPVRTDSELPASSNLYEGMCRYRQDGDVLEVYDGSAWTGIGYADPPVARMRRTSAQSIANTTDTTVTWDAEDFDEGNGHSTTVNPSRYTAPISGYYRVDANIQFAGNVTGVRRAWFWVNGSSVVGSRDVRWPGTTDSAAVTCSTIVSLTAGDYVEVRVYQSSGGALDVNGGTSQTASSFCVEFLRPL